MDSNTDRHLLEEQDRGEIDKLRRRVAELEGAVEVHVRQWGVVAELRECSPGATSVEIVRRIGAGVALGGLADEIERHDAGQHGALVALIGQAAWYTHDPCDGMEWADGQASARKTIAGHFEYYSKEATQDGWQEEMHTLAYGVFLPIVQAVKADDDGLTCDYRLERTPLGVLLGLGQGFPAPAVDPPATDTPERFEPEVDQVCDRCDATLTRAEPPDGWEALESGELLCPSCAAQATLGEAPATGGEG